MNKKIAISGIALLAILVVGWLWLNANREKQSQNQSEQSQSAQQQQTSELNQQQSQEKQQKFVVDVDPNMDHWQTKETEFFTIRFPKEWYFLESDRKKTGYYSQIITNNPDFSIDKYADIGVFTGGRYLYFSESEGGLPRPLQLSDTEVVISFNASATSDAGTPQDRIDSIFKLTKQNDPSVDCSVTNNKTIPFTMYCTDTYDSQSQQSYDVINNKISLVITARTTKDTLVKKEILDKIAGSIILK